MNATIVRQAILTISREAATADSEEGRQAVLVWTVNKLAAEANARVVITRGGLEAVEKLSDALVKTISETGWTADADELETLVGKHIDRLYVEVWGDPDDEGDDNSYMG